MKIDLIVTTASLTEMPSWARRAADDGYDGLFVTETTQDPFLCLAAAAPVADVDLGTAVALAFPRSPMVTAVAAWELQRASNGRFLLGLGSQVRRHIERRFGMPFSPPVARMREYVQALRHVWNAFATGGPCEFRGTFHRIDFLPRAARPAPLDGPPPTVWLAAFGPTMYRTAGQVADGAFVHPIHTVRYLTEVALPAIAEGLDAAGRPADACRLAVTIIPIVGSDEGARERARSLLAFYCSTPNYRPVLDLHGWGEVGRELHQLVQAGKSEQASEAVPDEMIDGLCLVADTWAEAFRMARERYHGLASRLSFYLPPPAGTRVRA
jgi:probable F420-dependent oxidoreductase